MKKIIVYIEGMSCASCVTNIERSLKKLLGVKSVRVGLLINKAFIEAEDSVSEEDINKAIKRTGYVSKKVVFE